MPLKFQLANHSDSEVNDKLNSSEIQVNPEHQGVDHKTPHEVSIEETKYSFIKKSTATQSFRRFRRLTRCKALSRGKDIKEVKKSKKFKVRTDKSAVVLVSIVIMFLITHCYRLALKVYEVASPNAQTMETFKICFNLKR